MYIKTRRVSQCQYTYMRGSHHPPSDWIVEDLRPGKVHCTLRNRPRDRGHLKVENIRHAWMQSIKKKGKGKN